MMTIDYSKYEGCTEGPWFVGSEWTVVSDTPQNVDHNYFFGFDQAIYDGKYLICESAVLKANAHLIADAPILLAHCKKRDEEVERLREALEEAQKDLIAVSGNIRTEIMRSEAAKNRWGNTPELIDSTVNITYQALGKQS